MKAKNIVIFFLSTISLGGAVAGDASSKFCSVNLNNKAVSAKVKIGFTAAICPPEGKYFKLIASQALLSGWGMETSTTPDTRLFLWPNKEAKPVNFLITLNDDTQMELIVDPDFDE